VALELGVDPWAKADGANCANNKVMQQNCEHDRIRESKFFAPLIP